jgi:hypothetical protein
MSCHANEILQGVRCYPNYSAQLNGAQPKPFWIYGHNPNTQVEAKAALDAGANALEPDIMYLQNALSGTQILPDGLYVYHDSTLTPTRLPQTLEDYLDGIHDLAISHPALSLVVLDIKPQAAAASGSAQKIYDAVHQHLLRDGQTDSISLNVIYSVAARYPDGGNIFPDLAPLIATGVREGLQVDGEDDPAQVQRFFQARSVTLFGFGDGTAGANLVGIGPNTLSAIENYTWLRADSGSPQTAYAFSIQDQETLKEYITTGVDAIITDTVDDLATIVKGRTDVRLATRDDNPFAPLNEANALKIHTGDVADAGTDANVTFTLTGCLGQATATIDTSRIGRMERNATNYWAIPSKHLGLLTSLEVSRDDQGLATGWWLDTVDISSRLYEQATTTANFQDWVPTLGLTATLNTDRCNLGLKGSTITLQQGSSARSQVLANALNTEAASVLSALALPGPGEAGIEGLSSLVTTNTGSVSATVDAACNADQGPHLIGIQLYDEYTGLAVTDNATITVTANTPPVLGTYTKGKVRAGNSTKLNPSIAPSDNGKIVSISASAPGFTGSFAADPLTGVISIKNAGPTGSYTVSVVSADNCGATSTQTFQLVVSKRRKGENGDGRREGHDSRQALDQLP